MPRQYKNITYGQFTYGERCGIIPDARSDHAYQDDGIEVAHRWNVWPDEPPRYKVCLRCHKSRMLTNTELIAYQVEHGNLVLLSSRPTPTRTKRTRKAAKLRAATPSATPSTTPSATPSTTPDPTTTDDREENNDRGDD